MMKIASFEKVKPGFFPVAFSVCGGMDFGFASRFLPRCFRRLWCESLEWTFGFFPVAFGVCG
ncbi:hypothetical protein C2G38_2153450 [Gigaspora rosea]|uniref:Uncharacterized protein n=1 Tax=Gigaspora rosea TaxID=44941 RepID=A0A397W7Q8_9GLOM|nr:hypothetical protein C2G38_2153450 [Gigaspora rosea]